MTDREWFRRVAAAGYDIEKRFNTWIVFDAAGRTLRRCKRRYEAEAFVSHRVGIEMRGIDDRIKVAAAALVHERAERYPLDRAPTWEGRLPTELRGHAVYRVFDHAGEVLYVGVTNSLFGRMATHRSQSHWWKEAAEVEWVIYPDRTKAERAEGTAIRRHRPLYNTQGVA